MADTVKITTTPPSCTIAVADNTVTFEGNFYYYIGGEFKAVKNQTDHIPAKDFLGMGTLTKRSNKKMLQFLVLGMLLALCSWISDKLEWLFFLDISWFSVVMNIALIVSMIGFVRYLLSKKSVVEISFLGKRICIDKALLCEQDLATLNTAIKSTKG